MKQRSYLLAFLVGTIFLVGLVFFFSQGMHYPVLRKLDKYRLDPEPGVRFGYVHEPNGDSTLVRFEFHGPRHRLRMASAFYGTTPFFFEQATLMPDSSLLAFIWPDRTYGDCLLHRVAKRMWRGACQDSTGAALPARVGMYQRPDFGQNLEPSSEDLAIIDEALGLLGSPKSWNTWGNRVCTDSEANGKWSLFCALYQGSLNVTGHYLHLRPAMESVRDALMEVGSERVFVHKLRDFNNDPATSFDEIREVLEIGRRRLEEAMQEQ